MADCPKCGRRLSQTGACPQCGSSVSPEKAKWYALAQETEAEEKKSAGPPRKPGQRPNKPPGSEGAAAKRSQWYQAAGMEAPEEPELLVREPVGSSDSPDGEVNSDKAMIQVAAGRKDPPWKLLIGGLVFLVFCAAIGWQVVRTNHEEEAAAKEAAASALPKKNIIHEKSYGYRVDPPDGFKQSVIPEPDWLANVHGEFTSMTYFKSPATGVEAYYFAEQKKTGTLAEYAKLAAESVGQTTPIPTVPEGMGKNPTKGYLLTFGDKKALVYVVSASQNRFISVYAVAPAASFDKVQPSVEAAIRAFTLVEPTGPHPDKQFAPPKSDDDE